MKKEIWYYIIGIVLFIISFIFDKEIFDFVQLLRNRFFDVSFGLISWVGSMFVILVIVSALLLWKNGRKEWVPTLWVNFFITGIICVILKLLVARERPLIVDYFPFTNIVDHSFPSLHAAAAFTALPILDREFPSIRWIWILFAFLVVFSRIYLGAHYLSDAIFGAMIGYGVGWLMVYLEDKKGFFKRWIWS